MESIAEVHGAALELSARSEGGLVVTVTFPPHREDLDAASPAQRAVTTRSPRAHTKKPARVNAP